MNADPIMISAMFVNMIMIDNESGRADRMMDSDVMVVHDDILLDADEILDSVEVLNMVVFDNVLEHAYADKVTNSLLADQNTSVYDAVINDNVRVEVVALPNHIVVVIGVAQGLDRELVLDSDAMLDNAVLVNWIESGDVREDIYVMLDGAVVVNIVVTGGVLEVDEAIDAVWIVDVFEYCDIRLDTDVMLDDDVDVVNVEAIDNAPGDVHMMRDVGVVVNVEVIDNVLEDARTTMDVVVLLGIPLFHDAFLDAEIMMDDFVERNILAIGDALVDCVLSNNEVMVDYIVTQDTQGVIAVDYCLMYNMVLLHMVVADGNDDAAVVDAQAVVGK